MHNNHIERTDATGDKYCAHCGCTWDRDSAPPNQCIPQGSIPQGSTQRRHAQRKRAQRAHDEAMAEIRKGLAH